MRNVWLLLKNYLVCGVGNFRRKNTRAKAVVAITIIGLIFIANFTLFTFSMLSMADALVEYNSQASVLVFGLIIAIFIAIVFALQKITGGQKPNDAELLLSMPFRRIEIMIAKALSRFCFNFLIVLMFFLPSVIAYLVYTPFSLTAFFGCVVMMLLIPLMAVGLSYVIDYFVTVCFANSKIGNIAKAFVTLIILVGVVAIYEFVVMNFAAPYMTKFISWMLTFNPFVMLPLITGVMLLFILGNWLNARLLNRESRAPQAKSVKISTKSISPFKAILKNESNRYFNSPTMMLNTIIGPLFMVILTIWLAIDHGNTVITVCNGFGLQPGICFLLIGLVLAAATILTYPAAFSISLEGKQLWILRSMPIPAHTILNAKVFFNILLVSPIAFVCDIILQIALHLSFVDILPIFIIPILTNVLISYTGVFVNLCFPKLEFESETAVIKQSFSSLFMMLGGMIVIAGLIGLTLWLVRFLPLITVAIIVIGILTVVLGIMMTLTYTVGRRMFNRL